MVSFKFFLNLFYIYLFLCFSFVNVYTFMPQFNDQVQPIDTFSLFHLLPSLGSSYVSLLDWGWGLAILLCCAFKKSRLSLLLLCLTSMYKFGYSEKFGILSFGTHIPILIMVILLFSPIDDMLKANSKNTRVFYLVIKFLVASYYFNAGVSKLLIDGMSWFSHNIVEHIVILLHRENAFMNKFIFDYIGSWFFRLTTISTIIVELIFPVALISCRWGKILGFSAICFHIGIHLVLGEHTVFFKLIPFLLIFLVEPTTILNIRKPLNKVEA